MYNFFQVCAESTTVIGKVFALIHAKEELDASRKTKRRLYYYLPI